MLAVAQRRKGTGSLYQRSSDGRWIGQYESDGRRRYVTGTSESEVRKRLRGLVRYSQSHRGTSERVAAYLTRWLEGAVRPSARTRTLEGYRSIVVRHLVPALGGVPLVDLSPLHIQRFMNAQLATLSPRTVSHHLAVLRTALTQAERWGLVNRNVARLVPGPRVPTHEIRPLTLEQAQQFLAAIRGEPNEALYVLAITTGMRQGELLGLRWQDVTLDGASAGVRVTRTLRVGSNVLEEPKTERSRRVIPLLPLAVQALRAHRLRQMATPDRLEQGLVFARPHGSPLDASAVTRELQRRLAEADLPRQRFHDLRHLAASLHLARGASLREIADILGHSTTTLTANLYSHLQPGATRAAMDRLGAILDTPTADITADIGVV